MAYTMAGSNNVLADFLVNVLRQNEEKGRVSSLSCGRGAADPESSGKYDLFSGNRQRGSEPDQSDDHGTDFFCIFWILSSMQR